MTKPKNVTLTQRQRRSLLIGVIVSLLMLWDDVGDYLYAYSALLSGKQYFSPQVWEVIITANHRPVGVIMIAQTAGWLYPIYALS